MLVLVALMIFGKNWRQGGLVMRRTARFASILLGGGVLSLTPRKNGRGFGRTAVSPTICSFGISVSVLAKETNLSEMENSYDFTCRLMRTCKSSRTPFKENCQMSTFTTAPKERPKSQTILLTNKTMCSMSFYDAHKREEICCNVILSYASSKATSAI